MSPKAAEQALSLIRQSLPAVADATRIVTNREALADEIGDYRPQDWADMGPGGVQAFYDPRTGQTTIFLENIEVREGETPMRAVARIILHERIAHAGLAVLRESDPAFARQWQQLIGQIPQDQLQAIAERYPELSGNLDALAEEWLASQVEARAGQLLPSNSLAGKMWAALKTAIGRFFGKFSRSQPLDAEVDRMIFIARNALKVQFVPAGPEAATALAFSKSPFEPIGFGKRYYLAKLDDWTRGEDIGREDITLGPTPPALQIAGADKRGLMVAPSIFDKVTKTTHQVPLEALRQLPEALADPIAIFGSRGDGDSFLVLTEFYEPGKGPVVIAVNLDVPDKSRAVVNRVSSLYERTARNLPEMISAKPLYLNTKKGRNWLRTAGLQLPGARGFQSGQANVPNEAGVVNLAKAQASKLARPGQRSRQRPHLLSRPARPDRTDHLVFLRKLHLPPSPASGPARKPKKIRIFPSVPGATSNMNPDAPFLAHSTSCVISPVQRLVPQTRRPALLGAPQHLVGNGPPPLPESSG